MRISDWSSDVCSSDLAVFDMPGLEIAVPIKFLALETRFIIEARLVDINRVVQQEPRDVGEPRVGGAARHRPALAVDFKDRAALPALRLGDARFRVVRRGVGATRAPPPFHTGPLGLTPE